jgi:ectoine hydroxylase-related dioxygenase (phytanoyl-CoA dioxygenase family)
MSVLEVNRDTVDTELPVIINELLQGAGVVVIRSSLSPDDLAESRDLIMQYSAMEGDKITHFHGGHEDQVHLQRRVWNLLNKGEVFERMVQHPTVMKIAGAFLGSEFIMGSVAANRLLPGGPGQEPHVDYPYWDLYRTETFPANINSSFPLNMQATFLLDDFTEENGATAFLPGSQQKLSWPDEATFFAGAQRKIGKAGDCYIFNGMVWHCAMPNKSTGDRSAILVEYLAKFITPLEDQKHGVRPDVVERATPMLRQLMSLVYPYPQILDEAEATVAYGTKAKS